MKTREVNCPLEPEIETYDKCVACYASMRHNPCPVDLDNPSYCHDFLGMSCEELAKQHPEWVISRI